MNFNENMQALDAADNDIQKQLLEDFRKGVLTAMEFQEGLNIMDELHADELTHHMKENIKKKR